MRGRRFARIAPPTYPYAYGCIEPTDAWGLPVARITLKPHPNDLAQGRFLIDRSAEILDAAGATQIRKV